MIDKGVVYVDNTVLKAVASCSLNTVVRHVQGWSTGAISAPLKSGQAGHEALAKYLKMIAGVKNPDYEAAMEVANQALADQYYDWAVANVPSEDRLAWENVRDVVSEYLTRISETRLPFYIPSPDFVEVGFSYPLDENGDVFFYGRMDFLGEDFTDRAWKVVDWKYTGRIDATWAKQWRADSQMTGYLWAALQHNPDTAGAYIGAIELSKLPSSDRKCREHGIPYYECRLGHVRSELIGPITRTPEQLEEWRKTALSLAKRYKQLSEYTDVNDLTLVRRDGTFTNTCRFCEFYDWCHTADRNIQMLTSAYEIDPWMPFDPRLPEGK